LAYDVWYTLPWAFEQFFDLLEPYQYITKVETFAPSPWNSSIIYPSRLRTLSISQNDSLPSIVSMPHVVQLDRIDTVHLSFHDWPTGLNLRTLRHVALTNNLIALKNFPSFLTGIRSIQILLRGIMPNSVSSDWSMLRSISALPMLISLYIVLDHVNTGLDETSCQIIAETSPMFVHFAICFRRQNGLSPPDRIAHSYEMDPAILQLLANDPTMIIDDDDDDDDDDDSSSFLESVFDEYRTSIEEIRCRILRLPFHIEPLIVVEEGGCGLTVWY
jgi:hypothetical protein